MSAVSVGLPALPGLTRSHLPTGLELAQIFTSSAVPSLPSVHTAGRGPGTQVPWPSAASEGRELQRHRNAVHRHALPTGSGERLPRGLGGSGSQEASATAASPTSSCRYDRLRPEERQGHEYNMVFPK